MITLYSTDCPKCKVLESKLDAKNIQYNIREDLDDLIERNIQSVPVLKIQNEFLLFKEAVDWVNEQEEQG